MFSAKPLLSFLCSFVVLTSCSQGQGNQPGKQKTVIQPMQQDTTATDSAVFAGGCFWCLDAVFRNLQGVKDVVSGYSNGTVKNPTYKEVCTGRTGHAEVVKVFYNPALTSYADLLEIFWRIHDPTQLNRQGEDVGTQYRSGIYFMNDSQRVQAEASRNALQEAGVYEGTIVTEIVALESFYSAEEYHQDYFRQNPSNPYCQYVVGEKVNKFKKLFREKLREQPLMKPATE
jgi:peptide-methionine (S)-S-oxide reductase